MIKFGDLPQSLGSAKRDPAVVKARDAHQIIKYSSPRRGLLAHLPNESVDPFNKRLADRIIVMTLPENMLGVRNNSATPGVITLVGRSEPRREETMWCTDAASNDPSKGARTTCIKKALCGLLAFRLEGRESGRNVDMRRDPRKVLSGIPNVALVLAPSLAL